MKFIGEAIIGPRNRNLKKKIRPARHLAKNGRCHMAPVAESQVVPKKKKTRTQCNPLPHVTSFYQNTKKKKSIYQKIKKNFLHGAVHNMNTPPMPYGIGKVYTPGRAGEHTFFFFFLLKCTLICLLY